MVTMAAVRQEKGIMAGEGISQGRQTAPVHLSTGTVEQLRDEKCAETRIPLMAATARLTHVYPSITQVLKGPGPVLCSTDRYRHVCTGTELYGKCVRKNFKKRRT